MLLPKSVPEAIEVFLLRSTSAVIIELKSPMSVLRCSITSMPRSRSSTSALTMFTLACHGVFQQPGGKRRREQPRVLLGHLALVAQPATGRRAVVHLRQQQSQSVGHVQVAAQLGQRLGIQRRHVDRLLDRPGGEEVDQQFGRLDGHVGLGLFGAGAQVRRAEHAGHAEQRALRAGLFGIHVQGHAGDLPALEPLDQRRFVVDAAAGAVDQPRALFQHCDFLGADQVLRVVVQRRVDREVIDQGEHFPGRVARFRCPIPWPGRRAGTDRSRGSAFPGQGAGGHGLADAAQADDAQRLAGQLRAHELLAVPAALDQAW